MAKEVHWYLRGWKRHQELSASGKKQTVWTYEGEYYTFGLDEAGLRRHKRLCAGTAWLTGLLWLLLSCLPSVGKNAVAYVGAPWFFSIMPLMVLLMGAGYMARVKQKMTYRDMYGAYQRLKYGIYILLPLELLAAVGEVLFLILYRAYPLPLAAELGWLMGVAVCIGLDVLLVIRLRRYPARLIHKS